jgi:predicted nucleic acid-binding protein
MAEDSDVVIWTLTRVELRSAFARLRREIPKRAAELLEARRALLEGSERWAEVSAVDLVRGHAEQVVERYPLRAADALQIAAAIVASEGHPGSLDFVTLDAAQAAAAEREGFHVLGP